MWRWHVLVVVMLAGFVAGMGYAQPRGGASEMLSGSDYAEIIHLFGRYNQGTDFRDAEMWLSVFTDDAVFQPGVDREEYVGKAALAEWRAQNFAARAPDRRYRHWNSSWVVTPTTEGATGRGYLLGINATTGDPVVEESGYYEDVYVETSDGWRIKERRARRDRFSPQ